MIIQSITIENFRSFYGEQTIALESKGKKNTTFIYAQNGVGKTNFLNAILWCLHGTFSEGFKREDDILNWAAKAAGRKTYKVSLYFEEEGQDYRVIRSGGDISNFKVFKINEGNSEPIQNDAKLFINNILPKDMAPYFISDGEGGDLAVNKQGLISIKKSIHEILGFTVAAKTLVDLRQVKKEIRTELSKIDKGSELSVLEQQIQNLDESIAENERQLNENRLALINYKKDLDLVEGKVFASDVTQIQQLKSQLEQARLDKTRFDGKVRTLEIEKVGLIKTFSWVAFADRLDDKVLDFIDDAEFAGKLPAPFNVSLVEDILKSEECICGAPIAINTEAYTHIKSLLATATDTNVTNRIHSARSRLTAIKTMKDGALQSIERNLTDFHESSADARKAEERIENVSQALGEIDNKKVKELENQRQTLIRKKDESLRTIMRLEHSVASAAKEREGMKGAASRIEGSSPRVKVLQKKVLFIEAMEHKITDELLSAQHSIEQDLIEKMNTFIDKYMRQNYKVAMQDAYQIGLVEADGQLIPVSGGQGAIMSFIYISSLISLARERRDLDSSVLTAGAIAPLIFDAPFSKLSPAYAENIAKELPKLVDQLVILMYQNGTDSNVADTVKTEGYLNKEFYLLEERAHLQETDVMEKVKINGKMIETSFYGASRDNVIIKEGTSYV